MMLKPGDVCKTKKGDLVIVTTPHDHHGTVLCIAKISDTAITLANYDYQDIEKIGCLQEYPDELKKYLKEK